MIYMVVSSGIAMEVHYCMGKEVGVAFYSSDNDKCGKCGMTEKKEGCCNDEHKFYKLSDSHKNVSNDIQFAIGDVAVITDYPLYNFALPVTTSSVAVINYSPPEDTGPAIFIRNCVFRI